MGCSEVKVPVALQGLKPAIFLGFLARLKSCPDTRTVFDTRSNEFVSQRRLGPVKDATDSSFGGLASASLT